MQYVICGRIIKIYFRNKGHNECFGTRACISMGAGSMTNFYVNGKLVLKKVSWKEHCIVDSYYGGLVCDRKLVHRFGLRDKWSAETMTNKGTVYNSVDASLIEAQIGQKGQSDKFVTHDRGAVRVHF